MSKYFETKEEFNQWILDFQKAYKEEYGDQTFALLNAPEPSDEDYINGLLGAGYTDLDNLVLDGHAYQIGNHKNDGWFYRDEIDKYFANVPEERIRDRK